MTLDIPNNKDSRLINRLVDRIIYLSEAKSNQELKFESKHMLPTHIKILKRRSIYSKDFLHLLEKKQLDAKHLDKNPLGTQLLIIDKINDRNALLTVYYYDLIESLGFAVNKKSFPNRVLNDIRNHLDQGTLYSYDSQRYKNTIVVKDYPNKNALALLVGIYLHRDGLIEKKTIIFLYEELLKDLKISFTRYDSLKEFDLLNYITSNFKLENSTNSLIKFIRLHYRGTKARHRERSFSQNLDSTYNSKKDYTDDNEDTDQDFAEYAYDQYLNENGDDTVKNDFSNPNFKNIIEFRKSIRSVSKSTVYTRIRRGQINIPRRFGRYDFDSEEAKREIENYSSHKYDKYRLNAEAIKLAERNKIKIESVKRKVRRLKNKGKSISEIIGDLREM